jgi:hypothetical protein
MAQGYISDRYGTTKRGMPEYGRFLAASIKATNIERSDYFGALSQRPAVMNSQKRDFEH